MTEDLPEPTMMSDIVLVTVRQRRLRERGADGGLR